jgi:hypothetical protein
MAAILAAGLAACDQQDAMDAPPTSRGRYAGIGTYPAGQLWSRMIVAAQPKDGDSARTEDDSQIIVVVDSVSGEVRQCGDLSGYCIGMNPWTGALGSTAPAKLTIHAGALARETGEARMRIRSATKRRRRRLQNGERRSAQGEPVGFERLTARDEAETLVEPCGFARADPQAYDGKVPSRFLDDTRHQRPAHAPPAHLPEHIEVAQAADAREPRIAAQPADADEAAVEEGAEQDLARPVEALGAAQPFVAQPKQEGPAFSLAFRQQWLEQGIGILDRPDVRPRAHGRSSSARANTCSNIGAVSRLVF